MAWYPDSMTLAPGPMHGLPSLQVRGVLWPTLNQVSLAGQKAGSQEVGLPRGPAGSAGHHGHQGACWLLCPHGDFPPAHVLPFCLPPGPSQDSGLGEHAGGWGESDPCSLHTWDQLCSQTSSHSVPTETHNVAQGVTGTRDQGTCVLIIPDGQGGSTRQAVLTLEESGPRAEPSGMKCAVAVPEL